MPPEPIASGRIQGVAELPTELNGARVLRHAFVTSDVEPTGATRHVVGGSEMGAASALAIAQYEDEVGFYLFCLDSAGAVVTDNVARVG